VLKAHDEIAVWVGAKGQACGVVKGGVKCYITHDVIPRERESGYGGGELGFPGLQLAVLLCSTM